MLKRTLFCLFAILALVAFGCGDDDDDGTTTADTASSSSSSSSGSDAASSSSSGSDATDDMGSSSSSGSDVADDMGSSSGADMTVATTDLCLGAEDTAYLESAVTLQDGTDATGRDAATEAAGACGLASLVDPDPAAASVACMTADPYNIALTDACAGCYGAIVLCAVQNCATVCLDASSQACIDCRDGDNPAMINCTADFEACSGL